MRETISTAVAALIGLCALAFATDGGRAFTAEGARRLAVARQPRPIPRAELEDGAGATFASDALRGNAWIVGFFYAECGTLCPLTNASFRRIQDRLAADPARSPIRLLSISFDRESDTTARLALVATHLGADPTRWTLARPRDPDDLERWLDTFGVVVIPDGRGGFEHNSALHVVDAEQHLVAVLDIDQIDEALQIATRAGLASVPPHAGATPR